MANIDGLLINIRCQVREYDKRYLVDNITNVVRSYIATNVATSHFMIILLGHIMSQTSIHHTI